MTAGPQSARLPGDRLHLHHGPIDLIIGVEGPKRERCFERAEARFATILSELVKDLPALRKPVTGDTIVSGPVARRMTRAVIPFQDVFVTPMAAVAGAVADEVLAEMIADEKVSKAYVNNGGDIACHLTCGARLRSLGPTGAIEFTAAGAERGLATSGWRGRSHSLGIADAVTVAARNAAAADVAATLIANAVDLPGHPAIRRVPASELNPDSDLGHRLVTVEVGRLTREEACAALDAGVGMARHMVARGLIAQAVLRLGDEIVSTVEEGALSDA